MSDDPTVPETVPEPTADADRADGIDPEWPPPMPPSSGTIDLGPPPTEEDGDAMFASFLWYQDASARGELDSYQKTNVAVLGERVIDAHPDVTELFRRLAARGDAIPLQRVLIQWRGSLDDPIWG